MRVKGHTLAGRYLVRNLGTGLVAYFVMCDCNYETPWCSSQQQANRFYKSHKDNARAVLSASAAKEQA